MAKKIVKKTVKKSAAKKPTSAAKKPSVTKKKTVSAAPSKQTSQKKTTVLKPAKPMSVAVKPTVKKASPAVAGKKPLAAVEKKMPVKGTIKETVEKTVAVPKTPAVPVSPTEKQAPAVHKRLNDAEVAVFKEKLLILRARLCGNINTMTDAALNKNRMEASGEISSSPIHMADVGSDNFEQEQTLTFVQSEGELLDFIDDALERIKEGTYGVCESCECPIPKGRLNIVPYASMCVKCAEIEQQGYR